MKTATFSNESLRAKNAYIIGGAFDANLVLAKGAPVAKVTASEVSAQVTFSVSGGTPTSGSAQFSWYGETLILNYNETAATLAPKLDALLGKGNYSVSGGPWPGTGLVVTLAGKLAGLSPATISLVASTLSAGTAAAAVTRAAVPFGRFVAWNPTKIARPTTALSVTATGSGGTFPTGLNMVAFTWANASGETLAAPPAPVTLTSGQQIRVNAINAAGTPDDATQLNVYVNGVIAAEIAVATPGTGGNVAQTDIAGWSTSLDGRGLPRESKAFVKSDGSQTLVGFLKRTVTVGYTGLVANGQAQQLPGVSGGDSVEIVAGGIVLQEDLALAVGTETEAVTQLAARILSGSLTAGNAEFAFAPYGGEPR